MANTPDTTRIQEVIVESVDANFVPIRLIVTDESVLETQSNTNPVDGLKYTSAADPDEALRQMTIDTG